MPQTGFPYGGIMPDDTETFKYSELIKTEAQIQELADAIKSQAYNTDVIDPRYSVTISTQIESVITAGLMLGQYWVQQVTYQGQDGYGTPSNPVVPQFSSNVSTAFLKALGQDSDKESMKMYYESKARNIAGIDNTFFNLAFGVNAFSWTAEGNLKIEDNYRFTSASDFTFAGGNFLVNMIGTATGVFAFGLPGLLHNTILGKALFSWFHEPDPSYPFYWVEFPNGGDPIGTLGTLEDMRFKYEWTPQEIYDKNPALFWDAVRKGYIPFSALLLMPNFICTPIEVGSAPSPFLPNYGSVETDCGDDSGGWSFGGGGNYPRPFTSFSQRIVEATYSLGPFAKFGNISGRIVELGTACPNSDHPGELGFVRQPWAEADIGNSLYTSNHELFKRDWWNQASKTKHNVRYAHLPGEPLLEVEVATASYSTGDAAKYDPDLPIAEDYSLLLGTVLLAGVVGAII